MLALECAEEPHDWHHTHTHFYLVSSPAGELQTTSGASNWRASYMQQEACNLHTGRLASETKQAWQQRNASAQLTLRRYGAKREIQVERKNERRTNTSSRSHKHKYNGFVGAQISASFIFRQLSSTLLSLFLVAVLQLVRDGSIRRARKSCRRHQLRARQFRQLALLLSIRQQCHAETVTVTVIVTIAVTLTVTDKLD